MTEAMGSAARRALLQENRNPRGCHAIETWAPRGFFLAQAMPHKVHDLVRLLAVTAVGLACASAAADQERVADTALSKPAHGVALTVYKKWIGAAGDEADVEIHLSCPQQRNQEPRLINSDRPGGWDISDVPVDGLFCSVREIERDTFVADVGDCLNLLVTPGQDVECTIVNTKVVKRIDMLNRYGLVMMIAVMLGAGLAAVRRFTPM